MRAAARWPRAGTWCRSRKTLRDGSGSETRPCSGTFGRDTDTDTEGLSEDEKAENEARDERYWYCQSLPPESWADNPICNGEVPVALAPEDVFSTDGWSPKPEPGWPARCIVENLQPWELTVTPVLYRGEERLGSLATLELSASTAHLISVQPEQLGVAPGDEIRLEFPVSFPPGIMAGIWVSKSQVNE